MSSIRPLRRLLRVLVLEEEQAQAELEAALARLHRLQSALNSAAEREHAGRQLLATSIHSGDAVDRLAALQEVAAAQRSADALRPRIERAEQDIAERREEFLAKRIERRQAETLLREAEAREASEFERRAQQSTDDWYLGRLVQRGRADGENSAELETEIHRTT